MNPEVAQLLAIIDQAYDKPSWHGTNLRGSVRRVTPVQAAWRPPGQGGSPGPPTRQPRWGGSPNRHNVWEIVVHAAYWKYAAARRFTGGARGSFPLKGSNWFERPSAAAQVGEKAWRADVELLDEMHAALRQAVLHLSGKDLDAFPRVQE